MGFSARWADFSRSAIGAAALSTAGLSGAAEDVSGDAAVLGALAQRIQICQVADPQKPASSFAVTKGEPNEHGDYWVRYACKRACTDWRQCTAPAVQRNSGQELRHFRQPDLPKPSLAFVVDGMGGHLAWTADGFESEPLMFIQHGGGGSYFPTDTADFLEHKAQARTVMADWQDGFVFDIPWPPGWEGWGYLTRSSAEPSSVPKMISRVAALLAWVHANLSGGKPFGAMSCSMGTNAIFGPVIWDGLDAAIDYQLVTGGPFFWDINRACGVGAYEQGYCSLDGVTSCAENADCPGSDLDSNSFCRQPKSIEQGEEWLYESVINHVYASRSCQILASSANPEAPRNAAFDEGSFGFRAGADWHIDHLTDFVVDVGGFPIGGELEGGDEAALLGHFMQIYNRIEPPENRRWHAFGDSHHCRAFDNGDAVRIAIEGMGLKPRLGSAAAKKRHGLERRND